MSYTIAITGKGGVGKTTVAALLVSRLIGSGCRPTLAVDADPNSCLDELLGVRVTASVGRIREEARQIAQEGMSAGISKQQLLELKIAESLVEADDFDLIAMGRPEGPGCYCYANNVLKQVIGQIAESYPYVVIDNEAGLENLSRRIVPTVDLMVLVADPSKRGLETAVRLHQLAEEMQVEYRRLALVVNRVRDGSPPARAAEIARQIQADLSVCLTENEELADIARTGDAITAISSDNIVWKQIEPLLAAVRAAQAPSAKAET